MPTLPSAMQDVAKVFFSYSLPYIDCGVMAKIWPHSTTLNNKGYKSHRVMGSVL